MALKLENERYIRVDFVRVEKFEDPQVIFLSIYKDEGEREAQKLNSSDPYIKWVQELKSCNLMTEVPEGDNIQNCLKIAAYKYLKTLPEYINSVDC